VRFVDAVGASLDPQHRRTGVVGQGCRLEPCWQRPRSAGGLDDLVGWRVRPWQWRQARSAGRWLRVHGRRPGGATTGAITHRAAMPPSGARRWGIQRLAHSYLPVVRCARVGLLPSRSGRIAMYAAAINRPSRTTPSRRVPIASALTGWSPASWAAACKRGRDAGHPRQARQGAPSSPMPFSNRHPVRPAAGQPCRQQVIVIARGDRRIEKEQGSYEVQGACGVLLAVCPVLGSGPGGFAGPLDDRGFAPSSPRQCQGQAGDRG
jgi:hypothetical protein